VPICEEDCGAERRKLRRSWLWWLRRELAYFPMKNTLLYHLQPVHYYSMALAILFMGRPPFLLDRGAVESSMQAFNRFYIVLAYWSTKALANFLAFSCVCGDSNTLNSPLQRIQQELWGYAWVRLIGICEAVVSAVCARRLKWNGLGTSRSGVNLVYELPIVIAFFAMLASMVIVAANYAAQWQFGVALEVLPRPPHVKLGALFGALLLCAWVLVLLWPVTSCVLADLLRFPYYRLGALLTSLIAATVPVAITISLFVASLSFEDD